MYPGEVDTKTLLLCFSMLHLVSLRTFTVAYKLTHLPGISSEGMLAMKSFSLHEAMMAIEVHLTLSSYNIEI